MAQRFLSTYDIKRWSNLTIMSDSWWGAVVWTIQSRGYPLQNILALGFPPMLPDLRFS
jgi:hypothetical protein